MNFSNNRTQPLYFWHERHTCYQLSYIGVALGYGGYGSLNMNNLVRFKGTLQMFAGNCRDFAGKLECRDFKIIEIAGNPHSIPVKSNSLPILQWKSKCGDFKITGIAGIQAITINLKSLHSDFPAKSLQFPANICSV